MRRDSSLILMISHYTVIKTKFVKTIPETRISIFVEVFGGTEVK